MLLVQNIEYISTAKTNSTISGSKNLFNKFLKLLKKSQITTFIIYSHMIVQYIKMCLLILLCILYKICNSGIYLGKKESVIWDGVVNHSEDAEQKTRIYCFL